MTRHARLTAFSRRLTPAEIRRDWFRRGQDYDWRQDHPTFPQAGPDGLFLLSSVEAWFDAFHGRRQLSIVPAENEEEAAMRAALGQG